MNQQTENNIDQKWARIKALLKDGKVHVALQYLKEYIHDNPSDALGYLFAGDCLTKCFRYDEAIKMYYKSIRLWDGKHPFIPYSKIGDLYEKKGQFPAAKRWYQKAVAIEKDDSNSLILLGGILGKQGKFKEAKKYYLRAIKNKASNIDEAYILLAEILAAEEQYHEALSLIEKALKIDPNYSYFVTLKCCEGEKLFY